MTKSQMTFFYVAMFSISMVLSFASLWNVGSELPSRLTLSAGQKSEAANELIRLVRHEDNSALRVWLVQRGPEFVAEAVGAIDDTVDGSGKVRLELLNAIYSLGEEGLDGTALKSWANALRDFTERMLHNGPVRVDFRAKSYLMERRVDEAATEYRRIPEHPNAELFFKQNPTLRSPASHK